MASLASLGDYKLRHARDRFRYRRRPRTEQLQQSNIDGDLKSAQPGPSLNPTECRVHAWKLQGMKGLPPGGVTAGPESHQGKGPARGPVCGVARPRPPVRRLNGTLRRVDGIERLHFTRHHHESSRI